MIGEYGCERRRAVFSGDPLSPVALESRELWIVLLRCDLLFQCTSVCKCPISFAWDDFRSVSGVIRVNESSGDVIFTPFYRRYGLRPNVMSARSLVGGRAAAPPRVVLSCWSCSRLVYSQHPFCAGTLIILKSFYRKLHLIPRFKAESPMWHLLRSLSENP